MWGVGYRLVDGASAELAAPEPAPPLAPAAAVAALPALAVGRPLDAALLAPWLLAAVAVGLGAFWRLQLRRGRELVARACHELRGPLTAAHLALHGGARHGEPPAHVVAVERKLDRAASRSRISRPRAIGGVRPTATRPSTSATCSPTTRSPGAWSRESSAAGSSSSSRARARPCAATACA